MSKLFERLKKSNTKGKKRLRLIAKFDKKYE